MTFLYPLGFLGLIAVPVLVFIYIIKNRYTEATVSSTYLWTLSEKFLRRRIPINMISGLLSLILQILAVFLISLILAHPVLYIQNSAREYCFILDASGSMNIAQGKSTRFEEGKKKIADIIDDSMNGSTYTLIYAGDSVFRETYYDKESALDTLYGESFKISYSEASPSDAYNLAQEYFYSHTSALTYLITDRTYEENKNVNVINVASAKENCGVFDIYYNYDIVNEGTEDEPDQRTYLVISGKVASYGSEATLNIDFYFDGSTNRDGSVRVNVPAYKDVVEGEETEFSYRCERDTFKSFTVRIREADSLALDNEVIVYNVDDINFGSALLVYGVDEDNETLASTEKEPNFLKWALNSSGIRTLTLCEIEDYEEMSDAAKAEFGLTIFYTCVPTELPDSVVWFVNPTAGIDGSSFNHQGVVPTTRSATFNDDSSTRVQERLNGVIVEEFKLAKYVKLGVSGNLITLISCEDNPLLLFGENANGNREVVFAFDFKDSADFTMSANFTTLIYNMLKYSFPTIIENTSFISGETLEINIPDACEGLTIKTPGGKVEHPDYSGTISEYTLSEVGIYTITLTYKDTDPDVFYVYSSLPVSERVPTKAETSFSLDGEPGNERLPGKIDNLLVIFIVLAVIAVADYGVYCYEQYQLR